MKKIEKSGKETLRGYENRGRDIRNRQRKRFAQKEGGRKETESKIKSKLHKETEREDTKELKPTLESE